MLKRLSLYGFKTFAKKTELDFGDGITCIVGPNGSGKSNISDALRWVLGEQGMKTLRGDKLTEVIFAGSEYSKPLNLADVVLLLENRKEKFPLKFSEIEITRRVHRDSRSDFLINKTPCRLKDIQEIFLDTGLGKGGISMIGQGQIDKIISADPMARRALFEETAGINKYQHRKNTALKKIGNTENNLLRLSDIIHEVEGRLAPLRKEVNRLKRFKRYKERISTLQKELLLQEYFGLIRREEEALKCVELATEEVVNIKSSLKKLEVKQEEFTKELKEFYKEYEISEDNYNGLRGELHKVRARCEAYGERKKEIEDRISSINQMKSSLESQILEIKEIVENDKTRLEDLNKKSYVLSADINSNELLFDREAKEMEELRKRYSQCKDRVLQCSQKIVFASKEFEQISSIYEEINRDSFKIQDAIKEDKKNLSECSYKKGTVIKKLEEISLLKSEIKSQISSLTEKKAGLSKALEDVRQKLALLYKSHSNTEVKLNFLKGLEKDFEGYFPGVKAVMKAKRKSREFSGIIGVVGSLIKVPREYEKAIEIALGGHIQDIVTESDEDARLAVEYLRSSHKGRATFLPLNLIRKRGYDGFSSEGWTGLSPVLGRASELIDYDPVYKNIIDYLLSHFYVVTDLKKGLEILKNYHVSATLVTLEGDIIKSSGAITGGSINNKKMSLLSRSREMEELQSELERIVNKREDLYKKEKNLSRKISDTDRELEDKRTDYSRKEKEAVDYLREKDRVSMEEKQLKEKLERLEANLKASFDKKEANYKRLGELQNELEELRKKDRELEKEKETLGKKLSSREEKENDISRYLTDLKIEYAKTQETILNLTDFISSRKLQIKQLKDNCQSCAVEIGDLSVNLADMKKKEERDKVEVSSLEESYEKASQIISNLKGRKEAEEERLETLKKDISLNRENLSLKEKVLNDNHLVHAKITTEKDLLTERIPEVTEPEFSDPKEVAEELETLEKRVSDMGFVNYQAQDEYEEVTARYSFLLDQKADMEEAIFSLHKVIEEADRKSKIKFKETFERVAEEFSLLYKRLFPGGKGYLRLEDEGDYLKSGVEVFINPPGKKPQSISLLSGGEKSMAALVLLFSLFAVKPTPFCVFDEVDAALDDANTAIFAECLREFSLNSQFIVISHNKITMEKADVLYGITMKEPGVSHIVSLKLSDPVLEDIMAGETVGAAG